MSTIIAPAKVNLNLLMTGQRPDGFHLLESDVVFTAFGDALSFEPSDQDQIEITGPHGHSLTDTSTQAAQTNNLCLRALAAFRQAGGAIGPLKITLTKNIPVGAGLGGGSADAAAALRYLAAHAGGNRLDKDSLDQLALSLGADVPVCLRSTSQHMSGIGEILQPIMHNAAISRTPILLANPQLPLATIDVFRAYDAGHHHSGPRRPSQPAKLTAADYVALGNDLDHAAASIMPQITQLLTMMKDLDGVHASAMSGSGASCFGLFDSDENCQRAAQTLTNNGYWAIASVII